MMRNQVEMRVIRNKKSMAALRIETQKQGLLMCWHDVNHAWHEHVKSIKNAVGVILYL